MSIKQSVEFTRCDNKVLCDCSRRNGILGLEKKEMLQKRRTSDLTRESTTGTSDHEMEIQFYYYSDSHDDLNSFQANSVRELKCLSD